MQIDIQARSFPLTKALREYVTRQVRFALTNCESHIKRVAVRLSDINGPRGGSDMRCQLQVVLPGLNDVVIEDTETSMYTSIDRATDRAGRTVLRKINRQQTIFKQRNQHILNADLQA